MPQDVVYYTFKLEYDINTGGVHSSAKVLGENGRTAQLNGYANNATNAYLDIIKQIAHYAFAYSGPIGYNQLVNAINNRRIVTKNGVTVEEGNPINDNIWALRG